MKKLILAALLLGSLKATAAPTVIAQCANETNDVLFATDKTPDGQDVLLVQLTGAEGTPKLFVSFDFLVENTNLQAIAINPDQVVNALGVIGEGLMVNVYTDTAILSYNGFIQQLACQWAAATPAAPAPAPTTPDELIVR